MGAVRPELDHHCNRPAKALIDQVLLVLQILSELVEDLASFGFSRVAPEYKVDENSVDDRLILDEAALQLKQELVLLLVLALGAENALHPGFDEPIERLLELSVRVGPLELEEVEVALLTIEVEPIDAVVVPAPRDLCDGALAFKAELLLEVQESKAVIAHPAAGASQIRKRLIDCAIGDCHRVVSHGLTVCHRTGKRLTGVRKPIGTARFVGPWRSSSGLLRP
jgi:hypothetical protein